MEKINKVSRKFSQSKIFLECLGEIQNIHKAKHECFLVYANKYLKFDDVNKCKHCDHIYGLKIPSNKKQFRHLLFDCDVFMDQVTPAGQSEIINDENSELYIETMKYVNIYKNACLNAQIVRPNAYTGIFFTIKPVECGGEYLAKCNICKVETLYKKLDIAISSMHFQILTEHFGRSKKRITGSVEDFIYPAVMTLKKASSYWDEYPDYYTEKSDWRCIICDCRYDSKPTAEQIKAHIDSCSGMTKKMFPTEHKKKYDCNTDNIPLMKITPPEQPPHIEWENTLLS